MSWRLRFLGVGGAQAVELGNSSAVIERDGAAQLMIDCGGEALTAYLAHYQDLPPALFFTHLHFDHIGGMERLFFRAYFDPQWRGRIRLYLPASLVPLMQQRVADYPEVLAEGGGNYWDAFQLIPVSRGFWHAGYWYDVFATRHHAPGTSFGLRLPGSLVYSGDTRPIPEALAAVSQAGEFIAHDCALEGNPSHSGIDDLERDYAPDLLARCVLYHYGSTDEGERLRARGHRIARPGELFELPAPLADRSVNSV